MSEIVVMDDWNLDKNTLGQWKQFQHYRSMMSKEFHKEWQIKLSLHLVLVTLYGWVTISVKQDNIIGDTRYNI